MEQIRAPCRSALNQIAPDNTLGNERSQVNPNVRIRGGNADLIEGGATRGTNLFHSFSEFNVNEGQRVYFANPSGIDNILSRVTGRDVSDIMGTLGVDGGANLFLLNPNGIIFGPNARLDLSGSFTASTANSFTFADGSQFSATNPGNSSLLSVSVPLGVQYGPKAPGAIANAGTLSVGQNFRLSGESVTSTGQLGNTVQNQGVLAVKPGQNLTLAGETVLNSGTLIAPGGTIQVLGDYVGLLDSATLDVSSATGGGTVLIGGGFEEVRSQKSEVGSHQLFVGHGSVPNAQQTFIGPNVTINADGIGNADGGQVAVWSDKNTNFQGTITARGGILGGDGGFIETSAKENLTITGTVNASAINGNSGTWLIDPTNITITNSGGGDIGDSTVNVANINSALDTGTNVEITTNIGGSDEGDITQESNAGINWSSGSSLTLNADNNITLNPFSFIEATGGGGVKLNADNNITLNSDSRIETAVTTTEGGDIKIDTGSFFLNDGAFIFASTSGQGNAGAIEITASDSISLSGENGIFSEVNSGAIGNSEGIKITTGSLSLTDGALISTRTTGEGIAGNINITANTLEANQGSQILTDTITDFKAGDINLVLSNHFTLTGDETGLFARTEETGQAGDITLKVPQLTLSNAAQISVLTTGQGKAGNINLNSDQIIVQEGSRINSSTNSLGNSGSITIENAHNVTLDTNSQLTVETSGAGTPGDINITTDTLTLG